MNQPALPSSKIETGMAELAGRIALVTGGARGIGRGIALRLAREGADIALLDCDPSAANETAGELRAIGRRALAIGGDVSEPADLDRAVAEIETRLGPIAILVNNAGICRVAPALETSLEDFRATFRVNVEGVFVCCRAVVPRMIERREGCVINMSSWTGKSGRPFFAAYSASKFAVIGLTQALAAEVAPYGVRVNAICPGVVVSTEMRREIEEAQRRYGQADTRERERAIPLGRSAVPQDIAGVAAFLASPDASYLTGEAINVSGGLWMD